MRRCKLNPALNFSPFTKAAARGIIKKKPKEAVMKNICKFFRVILCLAAVFAVLALLARRLSRGHEGHRYLVSKDLTDGD